NKILFNELETQNVELTESDCFRLKIQIFGVSKIKAKLGLECRFYDEYQTPLAFFSPGHHSGRTDYFDGSFVMTHTITFPEKINKIDFSMSLFITDPGKELIATGENILALT